MAWTTYPVISFDKRRATNMQGLRFVRGRDRVPFKFYAMGSSPRACREHARRATRIYKEFVIRAPYIRVQEQGWHAVNVISRHIRPEDYGLRCLQDM